MPMRVAILLGVAFAANQAGRTDDARESGIPVSTHSSDPKVLDALRRNVTVHFYETPLQEIVTFIRDYTDLNAILDAAGAERAGVTTDALVTLSLDRVPLGDVMEMLLEPLGLALVVRGGVLVVTDADTAMRPEVRMYPVADLVRTPADARAKTWLGERYVEGLLEAIRSSIEPEGWQSKGGRAVVHFSPAAESLIVSAGQPVHRKIEDFLAQLRRARELSERLAENSDLPPWSATHAQFAESSTGLAPPKSALSLAERLELARVLEAEARAEIAEIELERRRRKHAEAEQSSVKPASAGEKRADTEPAKPKTTKSPGELVPPDVKTEAPAAP